MWKILDILKFFLRKSMDSARQNTAKKNQEVGKQNIIPSIIVPFDDSGENEVI